MDRNDNIGGFVRVITSFGSRLRFSTSSSSIFCDDLVSPVFEFLVDDLRTFLRFTFSLLFPFTSTDDFLNPLWWAADVPPLSLSESDSIEMRALWLWLRKRRRGVGDLGGLNIFLPFRCSCGDSWLHADDSYSIFAFSDEFLRRNRSVGEAFWHIKFVTCVFRGLNRPDFGLFGADDDDCVSKRSTSMRLFISKLSWWPDSGASTHDNDDDGSLVTTFLFDSAALANSRRRSVSQLRNISTRLLVGRVGMRRGLGTGVSPRVVDAEVVVVFIETKIVSASWISCLYLTSASKSALISAFSLSAIARKRLRMEWISVNVKELQRFASGVFFCLLK